jgi:hypothetical protein
MSKSKRYIFLHIPKTAGRTLESILNRNFPQSKQFDLNSWVSVWERAEQLKNLPDSDKENISLVRGHYPFGLHAYLPGDVKYFSFLRSPVDRVISLYEYIRRNPKHHLYSLVSEKGFTIKDFLYLEQTDEFRNSQTRMIAGQASNNRAIHISESELLAVALNNIDKHFAFVGTMELFDISLLLLAQKIHLQLLFYECKNVSPNKKTLDDETIEEIKLHNELDLKLWNIISDRVLQAYYNDEFFYSRRLSSVFLFGDTFLHS